MRGNVRFNSHALSIHFYERQYMGELSPADMLANVINDVNRQSFCTVILTFEWDFRENFANIELLWAKHRKIIFGEHLLPSALEARHAVEAVVAYLCHQGWHPVERKTQENTAETYNPTTGGYWLGSGTLTIRYLLSRGDDDAPTR